MINTVIIMCCFLILSKVSNSVNDNRINEGASTSTQLTSSEECELTNYAERVVR